jgi:hypothetical protein
MIQQIKGREKTTSWMLLGVGIVFKFLTIPYFQIPLILGSLLMAYYYLQCGYKEWPSAFKQSSPLLRWVGLSLSFSSLALLYKLMYWPWAGIFCFIAFFLVLSAFMLLRKKQGEAYYKELSQATILFLIITFACVAIPRNALIHLQHWKDPKMADLTIKYLNNPGDSSAVQQYNTYQRE